MKDVFVDSLPQEIVSLKDRCEANEISFTNDDMSLALKFGQLLWSRLAKMADHYERMSGNFMGGDIRSPMMAQASGDMRHVLNDTRKDVSE